MLESAKHGNPNSRCIEVVSPIKEVTEPANSNLKAKPPTKFTSFRHNMIFLELPIFRGGLTLVPSSEKQLSNHPDSSDELGLVFLARRKS